MRATTVRTCLAGLIFLSALGAYSVGGIPIQWLAQAGTILLAVLLVSTRRAPLPRGTVPFGLLLGWLAVVTLVAQALGNDYAALMPSRASTPYPVFVVLRFLALLSFVSTAVVAHWLVVHGHEGLLLRRLVLIATVVSVASLYIYAAQVSGLPEPPRTRPGTGGGQQVIRSSYPFHRAMGTFREPSHLAEWLVAPLLLSFALHGSPLNWSSGIIAAATLLTGSLTGILAVAFGLVSAWVVTRRKRLRRTALVGISLLCGLAVFQMVATSHTGKPVDLPGTLWKRLAPALREGVPATNRGYVYEAFGRIEVPFCGFGLGHASIVFSRSLRSDLIASTLNLYLHIWLAGGAIGLALLGVTLAGPLWRLLFASRAGNAGRLAWILGSYVGWLLMFAGHSEELNVMFGVVYGLALAVVEPKRVARQPGLLTSGPHGSPSRVAVEACRGWRCNRTIE